MFDMSKATIVTDENMVDNEGNARTDVLILPDNVLKCHPNMQKKLEEAIKLFFQKGKTNDK